MADQVNAPEPIYMEWVDFVAGGTTPEDVSAFHPSAEAQKRLSELIEREQQSQLSAEQATELGHFL